MQKAVAVIGAILFFAVVAVVVLWVPVSVLLAAPENPEYPSTNLMGTPVAEGSVMSGESGETIWSVVCLLVVVVMVGIFLGGLKRTAPRGADVRTGRPVVEVRGNTVYVIGAERVSDMARGGMSNGLWPVHWGGNVEVHFGNYAEIRDCVEPELIAEYIRCRCDYRLFPQWLRKRLYGMGPMGERAGGEIRLGRIHMPVVGGLKYGQGWEEPRAGMNVPPHSGVTAEDERRGREGGRYTHHWHREDEE